jgi:hypothetical protein
VSEAFPGRSAMPGLEELSSVSRRSAIEPSLARVPEEKISRTADMNAMIRQVASDFDHNATFLFNTTDA